jgi:DNA-binding transcriptional regulator LsrR (DeoR family)
VRKVYLERKPQKKVAEEEGVSPATISRALDHAERQGILRHIIDEKAGMDVRRHPVLEQELCQKFGLTSAIVIDATDAIPELQTREYDPAADDQLHYLLGRALGDYLRIAIRSGDQILTVGGRGAFFPAKYLAELPIKSNVKNVRVYSLSGQMATQLHDWLGALAPFAASSVDADDAALYFTKVFQASELRLLNRPVAYAEGYTHRDEDFGDLFDQNGSPKHPSTLCICGVGRLGGRHMYMREEDFRLEAISKDIKELREILKGYEEISGEEPFYPVGDVANRLFPLEKMVKNEEKVKKALRLMGQINRKIVGLTFTQLSHIPTVVVNAGGLHKYPALKAVLGFRRPSEDRWVNVLCTDVQVAEKLLKDKVPADIEMTQLPGEEEA